jgi:hypothetical protein
MMPDVFSVDWNLEISTKLDNFTVHRIDLSSPSIASAY